MNEPMQLSLEQRFALRAFETQVEQMSLEQARQALVMLYEKNLVQEAYFKGLVAHKWGFCNQGQQP